MRGLVASNQPGEFTFHVAGCDALGCHDFVRWWNDLAASRGASDTNTREDR